MASRRFRGMRLRVVYVVLAVATVAAVALGFAKGWAETGDRVAAARQRVATPLRAMFAAKGLAYPPRAVYVRVFKSEAQLEMWSEAGDGRYALVKTYDVCASSGRLGPKRTEGDDQVPEGLYEVRFFNPKSRFHLSLGLDYPNASDRVLGTAPLGGDIMIHGGCRTIGCIPIGDDAIDEMYVAASDARKSGRAVTVHVFPTRMTDERMRAIEAGADAATVTFWRSLRPAYVRFEATHVIPTARVDDSTGLYVF